MMDIRRSARSHPSHTGRGPEAASRWYGGFRSASGITAGLLLALACPAIAQSSLPPAALAYTQLADAHQEAEAKALMQTLRCLVCQGQSIADSDAEMAGDMRALVRRRIAGGERPEQVRAWLIARYGDYVTYDPPFGAATAALWLAPLALLAVGAWIARSSFKRRS